MILNEQKQIWAWQETLFYLLNDGNVYECTFLGTRHHYRTYITPPDDILSKPISRIIAYSKIDYVRSLGTNKRYLKDTSDYKPKRTLIEIV